MRAYNICQKYFCYVLITLIYTQIVYIIDAKAQNKTNIQPTHGLSAFEDLKYPPNFTHFEYTNPNAPKGGRLSTIGTAALITFNSFNAYIIKGDPAHGLKYLFDTLMTRAYDEPDAVYALIAQSAQMKPDKTEVTFNLRKNVTFSNTTPLTARDVKFSVEILRDKGNPVFTSQLRQIKNIIVENDYRITFQFYQPERDLPLFIAAEIPIFSQAYYTENPFDRATLKPPIGSGPYKIDDFKQGRFIRYKRRDDYWGKNLPVNRGRFNFDELQYEYFRDRNAEFEAFKAGEFDLREEFTSKNWATGYDIPQIREKKIIRAQIPYQSPVAQGYMINTRRKKFADVQTRKAIALALDFEWTSKNLFYGRYKRIHSFFENSPYKALGKPSQKEKIILQNLKRDIPQDAFNEAYIPPVSDGSGYDRKLLRRAAKLLDRAGWKNKNGQRINQNNEELSIEFLTYAPVFERILAAYIKNLKKIGIQATIRRVDPAQYQQRLKNFDFDIIAIRFSPEITPGNSLRNLFSSKSADAPGSYNLSGIKNPAIDRLIEKTLSAQNREEFTTHIHVLDRVLRSIHFWIPNWYSKIHTIAWWNRFSKPKIKPKYNRGIIETWWFDQEKNEKLNQKNKNL